MNDLSRAMQVVDDAVLASRINPARSQKFERLRGVFSNNNPVNVSFFIRNMLIEGCETLPAPFLWVPQYASAANIAIVSSNVVFANWAILAEIRRTAPDCLLVGWMVDNHHIYDENQKLCEMFDVIIPAQYTSLDYLYAGSAVITSPAACPCVQWKAAHISKGFISSQGQARSDALYGGFRKYPHMPRNTFIEDLIRGVPNNAIALYPPEDQGLPECYLSWPAERQIADWTKYKVSVSVCVKSDIPMRLFDALATGQIPIVPWDMVGLDAVITPAEQAMLPVLRYSEHTPEEVARMRDVAVRAFDRGGLQGATRRHNYVLERHMPIHRARKMVSILHNMALLSS